MKLVVLFLATSVLSAAVYSAQCRAVATRSENGVNVQSETIPAAASDFGPDVVYEGGSCPAGKICVETMFITRPGRTFGVSAVQGQVIVLNKEDGSVAQLVPLRFREGANDQNLHIVHRGIPFYNQARWLSVCQTMENEEREYAQIIGAQREPESVSPTSVPFRSGVQDRINFCRGQSGGETYNNSSAPYIDIYRYSTPQYLRSQYGPDVFQSRFLGRAQGRNAGIISGVYNSFLQNTRARMVNFLNAGTTKPDGSTVQATSESYMGKCASLTDKECPDGDLPGGGGSMATLVGVVARARAALGCNVVVNPQERLVRALRESRDTLESACGFEYNPRSKVIKDPRSKRSFDLDKGTCRSSFAANEKISCVLYTDANRLTARRSVDFEVKDGKVVAVNFPEIAPGGLPGMASYAATLGLPNREEKTQPASNCALASPSRTPAPAAGATGAAGSGTNSPSGGGSVNVGN